MAHDESGECREGDRVMIIESRPLSKNKRWRVSKMLEAAAAGESTFGSDSGQRANRQASSRL